MASCERCWNDAFGADDQAARYAELLKKRSGERACTPEQQAGEGATDCPKCKRRAMHQVVRACMACGFDPREWVVSSSASEVPC